MKKKFICAVCGYIYEGDAAPEKCPICKAPASKFSELKDDADMTYATVHKIGDGKPEVSLSCWASAFGIPKPIWRSVLLLRLVLARISSALPRMPRLLASTLSTIPFTRWQRMRPVMVPALLVC